MLPGEKKEWFKKIPAVDRLLDMPSLAGLLPRYPRSLVLKAVHQVLDEIRSEIKAGEGLEDPTGLNMERVSEKVGEKVEFLNRPSLKPVVNATGIVVHTNLGRSLLAEGVLQKFRPLAGGYSNLEFDLNRGVRGSRYIHVEGVLKEITGAEAAMVVNNNAAAVLLCLDTLAKGREVIVSRGQLVEIGGSFRIPDVMKRSGAKMVEVGTTNKTHPDDYEQAIGPDTGLLLRVHQSNFQIVGFTEQVDTPALVNLGRRHGIPVMEDLGSGCFVDFSKYNLLKEPTVQDVVSQGVDIVTFSGDKMLGGPQAGIILGRNDLIDGLRKNQLTRALRIDKLTLLALEETLRIYRDEKAAVREIPTLRMILQSPGSLKVKARRLFRLVGTVDKENFTFDLAEGDSKVGGGALPLLSMPTFLLALSPGRLSAHAMESWLRAHDPPIIARVEKERVLLDVRTIQDRELETVAHAIQALAAYGSKMQPTL
ncbi:MAG: L-seryl-tRNA(Sec) selenium transferase [Deltaproteobacteria bacterium]|nr:L-seryl-tRNA(Sec) selenium transferase [Deltaproteobacteria bacterium]